MVTKRGILPLLLMLLAIGATVPVDSAKILCFFPTASRSHVLGAQALMKNLAKRGHQITMVSTFPLSKPVANYRDVVVKIDDAFGAVMSDFMQGGNRNMMKMMPIILQASLDYTNTTLNSAEFQELIKRERFDMAFLGWFLNDYIAGIGPLLKCPTILYFSAHFNSMINVVGNPTEIAAIPHMLLRTNGQMTFVKRVLNTLLNMVDGVILKYMHHRSASYYDNNFPAEKGFPSYDEAKLNISMVMVNSYFTQSMPHPYLPNVIEVGGLQIKANPDPLPADIQAWLDGAKHGAIFLSFGSNLKSSNLRQDKLDALIGTFAKLKQRIIWKWDTDQMPGKPANVMIGKWLPQDSILAHPNVTLFITHGGFGSITESMYHGVPIVGIPMFGDQDHNVAQVVEEGWGVQVSFDELNEQGLTAAIKEVLGNKKYTEKIQGIAALYTDRPQTALEEATFWVEYVIRHRGAPHMQYQGARLNFLQRYLIDVFVVLGVVLLVVLKIVKGIFKLIRNACCGGVQTQGKQKKN